MTEQSRLDAARNEASEAGGEWYRSPLALVAGIILFLGVLALVVLGLTGGDDTAAPVTDTADAVENGPAPAAPPVSFGGAGISEVDAVTVVGDPLPAWMPGEDDPAVGTLAPVITATSLASGSPITLGPGRARVIGFFAHWCPHCQDELPQVTEWLAATALPPNTEFIAVSTAVDQGNGNYPPSAWFNEVGFSSPVVVDDASATLLNDMGFGSFPAFVAIDASGVVVARAGGNRGTDGVAALFDYFAS
jgi:thiol-disulfide isomerase/thioredoxin